MAELLAVPSRGRAAVRVRGVGRFLDAAVAAMSERSVNARWQADMAPFFVALEGRSGRMRGSFGWKEVFHLD